MSAARECFDAGALLAWYRAHRREMPWRGHSSPYAVWVSEIMLQQTQVETVRPFFERFVARFPTVQALAGADTSHVLKAWEGLGYYARARNLQCAAKRVVAECSGRLPETAGELALLPGIGDYTAAAIASICFGERLPVVDGNVARVFSRLFLLDDDFRKPGPRRMLAARLQPAFDQTESPGDLNQAMMELGAMVCRSRNPDCDACPLRPGCCASRDGVQAAYPQRRPSMVVPERHAVGVVFCRGRTWLMARREERGLLGGLWELPGGPVEPHETPEAAACRWIRLRTGITVEVDARVAGVRHAFSHFSLKLDVVRVRRTGGRSRIHRDPALQWVSATERDDLPVATAHRNALQQAAAVGWVPSDF